MQRFMYPFRAKVSMPDRVLELIALILFIVAWMVTLYIYQKTNGQIPTHFNMNGVATQWSSKDSIWGISLVFSLSCLISATAAYNHKLVNLPIRLKAEVLERQLFLIARMCRCMTILLSVLWISALVSIAGKLMSVNSEAVELLLRGSLILLFIPAIYYTLKIWWIGRGYR